MSVAGWRPLGYVRVLAVELSPDPKLEQPEAARPARSDTTDGDHAALLGRPLKDRCHLDHMSLGGKLNFECGAAQVTPRSSLNTRGDRCVDDDIQANEAAAGAERQPIEVDRGSLTVYRCDDRPVDARGPHPRTSAAGSTATRRVMFVSPESPRSARPRVCR